jgi:hypothetical protein
MRQVKTRSRLDPPRATLRVTPLDGDNGLADRAHNDETPENTGVLKYRYGIRNGLGLISIRRLCLQIGVFGFRPNRPRGACNRLESGVDCGVVVAHLRLPIFVPLLS